jgi:hypothetical protein
MAGDGLKLQIFIAANLDNHSNERCVRSSDGSASPSCSCEARLVHAANARSLAVVRTTQLIFGFHQFG